MAKQTRDFIITILIVTFVFAFDDKSKLFQLGSWLDNFVRVSASVALVVFVHYFGHKWVARKYGADVVHKIWTIKRYGWSKRAHFPLKLHFMNLTVIPINSFPLGGVLAVIVSFLSNGRLYFTPVEAIDIKCDEHKRVGRWRIKVLERECARIALAGPTANILLALVLQSFNQSGMFDQLIWISCLYGLYHMIPVSELDGSKIFFGSQYLYVFGLAFLLSAFLLVMLISPGTAFFISVLIALGIFGFFFIKTAN